MSSVPLTNGKKEGATGEKIVSFEFHIFLHWHIKTCFPFQKKKFTAFRNKLDRYFLKIFFTTSAVTSGIGKVKHLGFKIQEGSRFLKLGRFLGRDIWIFFCLEGFFVFLLGWHDMSRPKRPQETDGAGEASFFKGTKKEGLLDIEEKPQKRWGFLAFLCKVLKIWLGAKLQIGVSAEIMTGGKSVRKKWGVKITNAKSLDLGKRAEIAKNNEDQHCSFCTRFWWENI